jgi:hypothetical protein
MQNGFQALIRRQRRAWWMRCGAVWAACRLMILPEPYRILRGNRLTLAGSTAFSAVVGSSPFMAGRSPKIRSYRLARRPSRRGDGVKALGVAA